MPGVCGGPRDGPPDREGSHRSVSPDTGPGYAGVGGEGWRSLNRGYLGEEGVGSSATFWHGTSLTDIRTVELAAFLLPVHAVPTRRPGLHDRRGLEPAAPCRTCPPHSNALHRLRPPRHHAHCGCLPALRLLTRGPRTPARAPWILRSHGRTGPSPGPGEPRSHGLPSQDPSALAVSRSTPHFTR